MTTEKKVTKKSRRFIPRIEIEYEYVGDMLSEELICDICLNPFVKPMTTPCNHIFCEGCIIQSLEQVEENCPVCRKEISMDKLEPNKELILHNFLSKLPVFCSSNHIGCSWQGPRGNLKNHRDNGCEFHICPVSEECDWKGKNSHIQKHAEICPERIVMCPNECGFKGESRLIEQHVRNTCLVEKEKEDARRLIAKKKEFELNREIVKKVNPTKRYTILFIRVFELTLFLVSCYR